MSWLDGGSHAPAIEAVGRAPLTYARLATFLDETAGRLAAFGVGRGDVVALVLPNGPDMATAYLAVSACAVAAPLNPALREDEFLFCLRDFGAKLVICAADASEAARSAALRLALPVVDLRSQPDEPAGLFRLDGPMVPGRNRSADLNGPDDVALMLHTSGTTARPKIVGLSRRNLEASHRNIARTLRLGPSDRCLNVMPLFHIHGLAAALGATLASGGAVVCTPGFNALRFVAWATAFRPTWCTAVPTMHQALLDRLGDGPLPQGFPQLRFVRSSSAALPASVFNALEARFGCPAVEAYGMTEAAHQMTSNPLDGLRAAGTVGFAAGPEVAVLDEAGRPVPAGVRGEIAVRGANVHGGYLANPDANAASFVSGWFRTGDQGVMDADGRLAITGRLKELINRGGEKISPFEVEEALLSHPDVKEAVSFAVPDRRLGEEIGAAVVLRSGADLTDAALRGFARDRIAAFKVPRRIVFLNDIPKGSTGKIQRIGMAGRLGLADGA